MRVSGGWRPARRVGALAAAILAAGLAGACDLTEVTVAEPEDLLVAEVLIQVRESRTRITAFLHRTVPDGGEGVTDARIWLRSDRLDSLWIGPASLDQCVVGPLPDRTEGACYLREVGHSLFGAPPVPPGTEASVEVRVGDEVLRGTTTMPGSFEVLRPAHPTCSLPSETELEVTWSRAPRAWAYTSETHISGLQEPLAERGIELEAGPLTLLGLSVSATDTTIVFPTEFGLLDRVDVDQDVLRALQGGLPEGTDRADVFVAAVDRNYVSWIRPSSFNPSGQVRVPSMEGDGTGFFGSVLRQEVTLHVDEGGLPPCDPDGS